MEKPTLTQGNLSRLAWLCDARVHSLKKLINDDRDMEPEDISEATEDIVYFEGLAAYLRSIRDANKS